MKKILLPFFLISQIFAGNLSLEAMNSVFDTKLYGPCDKLEKTFGEPKTVKSGLAIFKGQISHVDNHIECQFDAKGNATKIIVLSGSKYTQNQSELSDLVKEFGQPHFISAKDLSLNYKFEDETYICFFIDPKSFKISHYALDIYPDFISRKEVPLHNFEDLKSAAEKKSKKKRR